jgi:hypothetical protein
LQPQGKDRRTNTRKIEGARHYIEYNVDRFTRGQIGAHGTVGLRDGTQVEWFLWDGERPKVHSYAAIGGYIAALYKGELYDISSHHATYRSFGISDNSVRSKLWMILQPPVEEDGKRGVYPKTDRNSLLIRGGPSAGAPLPINDWAGEFADNMPDELIEALAIARKESAGTLDDEEWRQRLADRFGARWRIPRLRVRAHGQFTTDPQTDGQTPARRSKQSRPADACGPLRGGSSETGCRARPKTIRKFGFNGAGDEADQTHIVGGVPFYRAVGAADVPDGFIAAWQPRDPQYPEGVVLINVEHQVLRSVIEYWQSKYADHHADSIEADVIAVYGQIAVSKVAHSEHLKGILPADVIEKDLRSDAALTMSLLGLMAEDHLISTRIGGKYNKKRSSVAGT